MKRRKKKKRKQGTSVGTSVERRSPDHVALASDPAAPIVREFERSPHDRLWLDNAELLLAADIFDSMAAALAERGTHHAQAASMAESAATFRRIATLAMRGTVTTGAAWGQKWREGLRSVITPIRATIRAPQPDSSGALLEAFRRSLPKGEGR